MHTYKDLGSIKSSTNKTSESIKSEFTCCSISFARALVMGPILISLGLFTIGSSVYVGGVTVVGMSSSHTINRLCKSALNIMHLFSHHLCKFIMKLLFCHVLPIGRLLRHGIL